VRYVIGERENQAGFCAVAYEHVVEEKDVMKSDFGDHAVKRSFGSRDYWL
jgi:hypothetical protein